MKRTIVIALALTLLFMLTACGVRNKIDPTIYPKESRNDTSKPSEAPASSSEKTSEPTASPSKEAPTEQPVPETTELVTTEPVTTEPVVTEPDEMTYEDNPYYEVVETSYYISKFGDYIIIDKVLAKQDVTVSATVLAYDAEENVIGKTGDKIILTAGSYNFFRYTFDSDISDADLTVQWKIEPDSILVGDRNAVEMVKYNRSGDHLYITFKQLSDDLSRYSRFKILFYLNDQVVDYKSEYFDITAENLCGKDTTDVASVWVYNTEFDRIECFFEP